MTISKERLKRCTSVLEQALEKQQIPGAVALVLYEREEVHADAVGLKRDAVFRIASMTKPIVAAALLALVEQGRIRLFDPIDRWLPELANRQVMIGEKSTRPASRAITLHDLLTYKMGLGWGDTPLRATLFSLMQGPINGAPRVPNVENLAPDEFMKRLGALPLACDPGTRFLYHVAGDVQGVLLSRLLGKSLENGLQELIFEPLQMRDTAFSVPPEKQPRMTTLYQWKKDKPLKPIDGALWFTPPVFESGGGGLVSTADDYAKFTRIFTEGGAGVLSRPSVEAMCTDYLTPEEHAQPYGSFDRYDQDGGQMWTNRGFGYGLSVRTRRVGLGPGVGSVGWPGAYTTSWNADLRQKVSHVFLTQISAPNPFYSLLAEDCLTAVYQSLT